LAHNTDGEWMAIPVRLPLDFVIKYEKDGEKLNSKINLFTVMLNQDVVAEFTNWNNYEWDAATNAYINKPKCLVEFAYDPPTATFSVFKRKKYTAKGRSEQDPTKQVVQEVKGMDQKRKGEIALIQEIERWIDDAYMEATSYDGAYSKAIEIVTTRIEQIKQKTLMPQLVFESRDIKSIKSTVEFYPELKKYYDKMESPKASPKDGEWKSLGGSLIQKTPAMVAADAPVMRNKHENGCVRMKDLGIEVTNGETIQWIVSKYPRALKKGAGTGISQRVIPTILFKSSPDNIRKYLKRWVGYVAPEDATPIEMLVEITDWQYFMVRFTKKVFNVLINPFLHQKKWLHEDTIARMQNLIDSLDLKKMDMSDLEDDEDDDEESDDESDDDDEGEDNLITLMEMLGNASGKRGEPLVVPVQTAQAGQVTAKEPAAQPKPSTKRSSFKIDDFI